MTISVRFSDNDDKLVKAYAQMYNKSVSDFIRETVMDRIEDEHDLQLYNQAMEEYKKNPITYSHAEVMKMFSMGDDN
jgi:RHH-type transcriptional regulator, rel operon repressor / antitoxin RelB